MPERFLFVELGGLDRPVARCAGRELEIILLLDRSEPMLATGFGPDHLSLFCAPAINLFPKRSDRVNLSEREVEHHVVPDRMRPLDFEVFSVASVEGYAMDGGTPQPFLPFYAANDLSRNPDHRSYYILRREPRQLSSRARQRGPRSSYLGHEVFISLVDPEQAPFSHGLRQLGLDLLCTNRDLPLSMPVGKQHTDFTIAVSAPVAAIRCVVGPTPPRPCRGDGEYAWRFLSHLGLNYLSLVDTDALHGAAALRELLRLYLPSSTAIPARQLEGLLSVACHPIVRRLPGAGPVAAGRGLEVTLTIDETPFGGAGGILLASVLDRFFAKYVSINAFTETVLRNPERGEVMRWPMQIGQRPVL
jgi:type VI secretion system protein ImpG